ncbi:MAG: 16S rRNA (cytosine(967)-C(5))-methyltransferase RsmB [Prevotella sp.]|nr:16S rRNA (cytosine(967)-C(5))-methyltransferase RsmB [Prevotella sp.]
MGVKSPRFTVLELLAGMDKQAYSNIALDSALERSGFSDRDKSFVSRLFYGTVERKLTLEYIVSLYSNKPLHKLDASVLNVLKMGLYQLLYMDSVTDSAAVNESVVLAKQCGKTSAAGFVNAVLRSFIRDGKKITFPEDRTERLGIEYSCGQELVRRLCGDYSFELAEDLLKASVTPHKTFLRVNNLKISSDELVSEFEKLGVAVKACDITDNCLEVDGLGDVERCELFRKGFFHVQDLSSQLCCKALNPCRGDTVIDLCAAPGGKAFTVTEMTGGTGRIIACDIHSNRVNLIKSGAERLGLPVEAVKNDAKVFNADFPLADKVLCDVPCSGFGVIRSKPELKYTDLKSVSRLPEVQYGILCTASEYLKAGGELVYSTCTLSRDENDRVIDRFLEEHKGFKPVAVMEEYGNSGHKATIFPKDFGCEGFFMSKIGKDG